MHLNSIYSTSFFYKIGPLIILLKQFALGAVNERTTTSRLHFPFRIHEEDNFTSVNLDDVSGKFWLAMNYTYTVVKGNSTHISASEGYFDLKLTRFDVRDGLPDDNFPGELDKVWANDKGWPVNLILSFPDLGK